MADGTYQPKVYRDLGGNRFNIVSGGALNIEAGSTNTIAGAVTFSGALTASGANTFSGVNTFSGAVRQTDANPNATTTASAIVAEGRTLLATTAGVEPTFHLAAPVAGAYVHLIGGALGSTAMTVSTTGASATIGSTFTSIAFNANAYGAVALRGVSATRWDIIGSHGASVVVA